MKRIICIGFLVLFLMGCEASPTTRVGNTQIYYKDSDDYDKISIFDLGRLAIIEIEEGEGYTDEIYAYCEDRVICYAKEGGCLRYKDLVDKYCGMVARGRAGGNQSEPTLTPERMIRR